MFRSSLFDSSKSSQTRTESMIMANQSVQNLTTMSPVYPPSQTGMNASFNGGGGHKPSNSTLMALSGGLDESTTFNEVPEMDAYQMQDLAVIL